MPRRNNEQPSAGAQRIVGRKEKKELIISRESLRAGYKAFLARKKLQSEHWQNQRFQAK